MKNILKKFLCAVMVAVSCVFVGTVANAKQVVREVHVQGDPYVIKQLRDLASNNRIRWWVSDAANPSAYFEVNKIRITPRTNGLKQVIGAHILIGYDDADANHPAFLDSCQQAKRVKIICGISIFGARSWEGDATKARTIDCRPPRKLTF